MQPPVTRYAPAFRPDIEGLRGLAVLVVVLFHAGIVGVGGGFVGVDVFFVLSGFLITGLLLRERERTGRIGLVAFYARRVRRLVPAATVVLVATLAASWILLDPLTRIEVLLDGAAAALSVGNIRFALGAGDYFAPVGAPSPFLQFWSLGVEEQFYLAWPLLLIIVLRARAPRLSAGAAIASILVASFALNLVATGTEPAWAFYSLPTRAWQLAVGGLLAVAAAPLGRLPSTPLAILGWLGLASVAAAAVTFGESLPYPGSAALLPTLGAAAILLAGSRPRGPAALLSTRPLRFLGRISYSLYLWHWPLLVLAAAAAAGAAGELLPFHARIGLVGLAVGLATATCLLVEEPFRFGRGRELAKGPATRRPRARLALVTGLTALVAISVTAGSLSFVGARQLDVPARPHAAIAELELSHAMPVGVPPNALRPTASADPSPSPAVSPSSQPALSPSPIPEPVAPPESTPPPEPAPEPPPVQTPPPAFTPIPVRIPDPTLPPGIEPPLSQAPTDQERLKRDRCIAYEQATTAPDCVYGSSTATFTVALVGDSHGSHWFPALEAVAAANGWRLVPFVKVSCPFIDLPVESRFFKREYTECAAFRESTIARLTVLQPDLTIVAQNKWVVPVDAGNKKAEIIGASLGRTLLRVPGRVALLVDTPHATADVPTCLAANPTAVATCATPRARAMSGVGAIEKVAAQLAGVPRIDLRDRICVANPCPAIVDGRIVYRDSHHLTATFARSLAPALGEAIAGVIGG